MNRIVLVSVAAAVLLLCFSRIAQQGPIRVRSGHDDRPVTSLLGGRDAFVRDWSDRAPGDPMDAVGVVRRAVCHVGAAGRNTTPLVVWQLHKTYGGIGNIRSVVIDFVFWALLSGGSFVLPARLQTRENQEIEFSQVFDVDRLVEAFGTPACGEHAPAMFSSIAAVPRPRILARGVDVLTSTRVDLVGSTSVPLVEQLRRSAMQTQLSRGNTIVVRRVKWRHHTLWNFDITSAYSLLAQGGSASLRDADLFRHAFGRLFVSSKSVRGLAASAVYLLAERYPSTAAAIAQKKGVVPSPRGYCGAHLRTEADMAHMQHVGNSTQQIAVMVDEAVKQRCSVLYIGGGTDADVSKAETLARIEARRSQHPLSVVTKRTLLASDEALLKSLTGLAWDVQALVDYEVLSKAYHFSGVAFSSFSWNIAIRRNFDVSSSRRKCALDNASVVGVCAESSAIAFDDGLSKIFFRLQESDSLRPDVRAQLGMWP